MPQQRDLQTGAIILLASQKPPSRQVLDWLNKGLAAAAACESSNRCQQDSAQGQQESGNRRQQESAALNAVGGNMPVDKAAEKPTVKELEAQFAAAKAEEGQQAAASGAPADIACRNRSPSPMPGQMTCPQRWHCLNGWRPCSFCSLASSWKGIPAETEEADMLMLAAARVAAAAEEAEDGQLPGSSSEAEVTEGAASVLAASQALNGSNIGRLVKLVPLLQFNPPSAIHLQSARAVQADFFRMPEYQSSRIDALLRPILISATMQSCPHYVQMIGPLF